MLPQHWLLILVAVVAGILIQYWINPMAKLGY